MSCPRCECKIFRLARLAGVGRAHVCEDCGWPRAREGAPSGGMAPGAAAGSTILQPWRREALNLFDRSDQ